jgi:putative tricarboxylic transport membrane protein
VRWRKALPFVVLMAGAAYLYWRTLGFEFQHVPGRLGPDAWPQIALILLIASCLCGLIAAFVPASEPASPQGDSQTILPAAPMDVADEGPQGPSRYGLVALAFALFLVYPVALVYLGFPVATFLLLVLFMIVGQWHHTLGILASSLVGTLVLFYMFRGIVYISLPLGVGPFEDFTLWLSHLMHIV